MRPHNGTLPSRHRQRHRPLGRVPVQRRSRRQPRRHRAAPAPRARRSSSTTRTPAPRRISRLRGAPTSRPAANRSAPDPRRTGARVPSIWTLSRRLVDKSSGSRDHELPSGPCGATDEVPSWCAETMWPPGLRLTSRSLVLATLYTSLPPCARSACTRTGRSSWLTRIRRSGAFGAGLPAATGKRAGIGARVPADVVSQPARRRRAPRDRARPSARHSVSRPARRAWSGKPS